MHIRTVVLVGLALTLAPTTHAQTWTQLTPTAAPTARWQFAMSFDLFRNRFVVFGGRDATNGYLNDTWEFDGTTWTAVPTTAQPPARWLTAMIFHPVTGRNMLFGGRAQNATPLNDTWLWDGMTWTQAQPATSPPPRSQPTLAFDSDRNVVVLFGGTGTGSTRLNDTWEWDGVTWTQIVTPTAPSGRNTSMAYDASRRRMVIFGGDPWTGVFTDETWEFDGADWSQVFPAISPPPRASHSLDHDRLRQRIVLYGGLDQSYQILGDTWEYDGTTWTLISPALSPTPPRRDFDYTVYDPTTGKVFLFGGRLLAGVSNETWTYEGATTGLFSVYGASCGSAPTMAGTTPTIGQSFDLTFGSLGSAVGVVIAFGLSDTSWNGQPLPFSLAVLGLPACDLRSSADLLDLSLAVGGTATYSWALPNTPSLVNQAVFCQGVAIDVTAGLAFQGTTGLGRLVIGN